eukprot:CAMPEP_0167757654 /NCGR_PEP_ID=MMETSP0110_2-20121227/10043_1 /TAXON_ID=629695 /ORGANISM="Gymnochlora sp., Strain CCMP2014" /LENGTH=474 /DNA_ID=CAMNT_0007643863 /DNA_START=54 /DNA_END=1478 /DNA_ORIENTATION=-
MADLWIRISIAFFCFIHVSSVSMTVTNGEAEIVDVMWIGAEGNQVKISDVGPGQSTSVNTFAGHKFEMRGQSTGNLLLTHIVTPSEADNHIKLGSVPEANHKWSLDESEGLGALGNDIHPQYIDYIHRKPYYPRESPMGVKFRNFFAFDLDYYYDDGSENGVYNGIIKSMGRSAIISYSTHRFILKKRGTNEEIKRVTMKKGEHFVILWPSEERMKAVKKTKFYKDVMQEKEHIESYQERTGLPWLAYYPRNPPILPMWPAEYIGQEHSIEGIDSTTLKVISLRPRIFFVSNLLNKNEREYIINYGKEKAKRSAVGNADAGFVTETRTSRTAWIPRTHSPLMNKLFTRFSKVLNISDDRLTHSRNAENLQVVYYGKNQKYSPHHDFNDKGSPPQRFLTLFIYLQPAKSGGGTGFPLAMGRRGIKVTPKAGDAVLWYNMLPDGNADEMSLHEGMPVGSGEKWGCNLWVWDPYVNF